jgi:hypothetical protein
MSLVAQMLEALYTDPCSQKCVFVIGYVQEPLFFTPWRGTILNWLNIESNHITEVDSSVDYPTLGEEDIVVHVRCCQHAGGGCDWLYLPFEYYDAVLSRMTARAPRGKVYVVAPCTTDCEMMDSFRRKYHAIHVTPPKWRNADKQKMMDTMADDFRFLLKAKYLLLGMCVCVHVCGLSLS